VDALFGSGPAVRRNFRWDMAASVGAGLFTVFTLNFAAVVARRAEADALLLSAMLAAPFAGNMLAIFSGYLLPRQGRHAFAARLIALARGLWLLAFVAATPLALTGMVLGYWVLVALVTPVIFEVLRDIYPPERRGRLLGYTRIGLTGSMTLGSLVAGVLLDLLGPNRLLPLGALFGIGGALAWGRLKTGDEAASAPMGLGGVLGILRHDRRFALYAAALACWGFGLLLPGPLFPILLVDRFGASYSEVGALGFVTSAAWLLGYVTLGRRIDRWSPLRVTALSFGLCVFQPICYLVSPNVWLLAPGAAAVGFASAGIDLGGINVLMRLAPRERLPEYSSLLTSIAGLRGLIAPFVGSALAALPLIGVNGVLILAAALILLGATIVARTGEASGGRHQVSGDGERVATDEAGKHGGGEEPSP
jgi:MFS family permease